MKSPVWICLDIPNLQPLCKKLGVPFKVEDEFHGWIRVNGRYFPKNRERKVLVYSCDWFKVYRSACDRAKRNKKETPALVQEALILLKSYLFYKLRFDHD